MTSLARLQLCNDAKRLHYILGANSFGVFFFQEGSNKAFNGRRNMIHAIRMRLHQETTACFIQSNNNFSGLPVSPTSFSEKNLTPQNEIKKGQKEE